MIQKKVCMLGVSAVGKTSLVRRFVDRMYFSEIYKTTVGVSVDKKTLQVNGQDMGLVLWDVHGDDAFERVRVTTFRGMSGYLLVADGTRRQTLEEALTLSNRVTETMGEIPCVLALNKCDLREQWEIEPDRETALGSGGRTVIRTSAKTGEGVEEAFSKLALAMLAK
jgi:small GTP-binding protein